MAHFLFIDESGHDHQKSPYEVLAGIAIEDHDLWNLIKAIHQAELQLFGVEYRQYHQEIKAKKILNTKTFRKAEMCPAIPLEERKALASACLKDGSKASKKHIAALSQAKLDYAREILELCSAFRAKVFASILVSPFDSSDINQDMLRKDYVLLFSRFYQFLDNQCDQSMGCIVFDELEKTQSRILVRQMERYYKRHFIGQAQSSRIIPEPFFVHSDLTTGVQIVDLLAYLISWGLRFGPLTKPSRPELSPYIELVKMLRFRSLDADESGNKKELWSTIAVFDNQADG